MRVDAKKSLADSDKDRHMQDGFRRQLPELNVVGKEEATYELVGWKGQPTVQEGRKHGGNSSRGIRARIITWEADVLLVSRNQPETPLFLLITHSRLVMEEAIQSH
jgi:hypothetical protein